MEHMKSSALDLEGELYMPSMMKPGTFVGRASACVIFILVNSCQYFSHFLIQTTTSSFFLIDVK